MCVDFFLIQYNGMVSLRAVFHGQVLEENAKDHLEGNTVRQKINTISNVLTHLAEAKNLTILSLKY